MSKSTKITIGETIVSVTRINEEDYICLTDMARFKDADRTNYIIQNWMRVRSTIEFLGLWEQLHNESFKSIEFDAFKNEAGSNSFSLTPKKWIETTNATGIISKSGRYGGTYAHKDIAFEFGTWLSPTFKLYLITEFQRLKEIETNQYNLEWDVKRILSKANYHLQTDAVQKHILPTKNYRKDKEWIAYAEEADILNVTIFNCTAKDWRDLNTEQAKKGLNIRDFASINELAVLSNIESLNSIMIRKEIDKTERFSQLQEIAEYQLKILDNKNTMKAIKKLSNDVYINKKKADGK
jgi:hypothetical protein